jgi:hypothetical protein
MREDCHSTHVPAIRHLFPERHVYVRAGMTSRFVTISRALQIWVTLGATVLVVGLGLASYAAVAKHVEAVAQGREVARLEAVTKALQARIEAAEAERATRAVPVASDLAVKLAEAKADRERALDFARASAAEAAELRRELTLVEDQRGELPAALVVPLNRATGQGEGSGCPGR